MTATELSCGSCGTALNEKAKFCSECGAAVSSSTPPAEAEAAIERLAAAPAEEGLVIRDTWLLRLRALLARARGDDAAYAHFRDRCRDMAKTLEFDGHIAWARGDAVTGARLVSLPIVARRSAPRV